jgi:hypothetical protein
LLSFSNNKSHLYEFEVIQQLVYHFHLTAEALALTDEAIMRSQVCLLFIIILISHFDLATSTSSPTLSPTSSADDDTTASPTSASDDDTTASPTSASDDDTTASPTSASDDDTTASPTSSASDDDDATDDDDTNDDTPMSAIALNDKSPDIIFMIASAAMLGLVATIFVIVKYARESVLDAREGEQASDEDEEAAMMEESTFHPGERSKRKGKVSADGKQKRFGGRKQSR